MTRALIAVTHYNKEFYPDGKKTGLFWSEALHPYNVFTKAGLTVDVASETGTNGLDEHSIADDFLKDDQVSKEAWEDPKNPLKDALEHKLLAAKDVDASKYDIFYAAGGHGASYSFPSDHGLQEIASKIYAENGVVSAVCHGPAILPGIKDQSTGEPIIKGKRVTGFTKKGEEMFGVLDKMRKDNVATIEEMVSAVGAIYVEPPEPMANFTVTDGRIVTGVNPPSAASTAQEALKALKSAS